jgi:hypothetical protein
VVRPFGPLPPATTAATKDEQENQDEQEPPGSGPDDDGLVEGSKKLSVFVPPAPGKLECLSLKKYSQLCLILAYKT